MNHMDETHTEPSAAPSFDSSFDAADLAEAILGPTAAVTMVDGSVETLGMAAAAPTEPITAETAVVPAWARPPTSPASAALRSDPSERLWTDAQRALLAVAVLLMMVALVGMAAMSEPGGPIEPDPPPCGAERGLFDEPGC